MIGLACFKQVDLRALIAYSSIRHISLVLSGVMLGGNIGLIGCLLIILGHGISSSGLFYMSGVNYERCGSRIF